MHFFSNWLQFENLDWGWWAAHFMLCAHAMTISNVSTECSRRISRWGSLVTSVTISISQFAIVLVTSVLGLLVPWYARVGRSIATMAWQWHGPRMVESSQRWKLSWFPIHIFPIEGQLDGMYFEPSSITMAVMEYYNTWMGITWNNYYSQTLLKPSIRHPTPGLGGTCPDAWPIGCSTDSFQEVKFFCSLRAGTTGQHLNFERAQKSARKS